ncbi:hypothetical protein CRG98_035921 [Punica granatum]|uniref:Uncharacterized protein n=1 Tax=Punica granatum TaxID=22663 RepID=A0A2I0IK18_PUNGR|nr:hypothetical protein CRG98_035921 [Punica granatum]
MTFISLYLRPHLSFSLGSPTLRTSLTLGFFPFINHHKSDLGFGATISLAMARNIKRELRNPTVEDRVLRAQADKVISKFVRLMNLTIAFNVGGSIVLAQNPAFHC